MFKIVPSLLSADFSKLKEELAFVEEAGCEIVHLDVMDGHFVKNITFGPIIVEAIRKLTDLTLDVHLMIENPESYIEKFAESGSDWITFHIETVSKADQIINKIRKYKKKAGISLNPSTPIENVEPYLSDLDLVLVMSVNPGFGGQSFIPEVIQKIKALRGFIHGNSPKIEVDGGINKENIKDVVNAGAELLVCGSAIFKADDPKAMINQLNKQVNSSKV